MSGVPVDIVDSSKLTNVYGYWISFHDASVESVTIERVGPTVTIKLETCDEVCHGGMTGEPDQKANVVLRWSGVEELNLSGIDPDQRNWIDGITFSPRGDRIKSVIERMDSFQGVIVSRRVEVLDVAPRSH